METNQETIENLCGLKPKNIEIVDVGNNPDYVFLNDPSFQSLNLYDIEGNTVIVNSWVECAHYITGGLSNTLNQIIPGEKYIVAVTGTCILTFYLIKNILNYVSHKATDDK